MCLVRLGERLREERGPTQAFDGPSLFSSKKPHLFKEETSPPLGGVSGGNSRMSCEELREFLFYTSLNPERLQATPRQLGFGHFFGQGSSARKWRQLVFGVAGGWYAKWRLVFLAGGWWRGSFGFATKAQGYSPTAESPSLTSRIEHLTCCFFGGCSGSHPFRHAP